MLALRSKLDLKAKLYRGLADPSRLSILETLRHGPKHVNEIVSKTGLTQSNASMHLDCLYCCGIVEREKQGRFVYYRIRSPRILKMLEATELVLKKVASHIEDCARYEN